ncbi:MAG: hypothetical protein M1813_008592 [Trichoglossum hirsutum]|nr:MAG: hypothetical protein M1813_008592 [Trichoglossum hirsutum]
MADAETLCGICEVIDFEHYLKNPIQPGWRSDRGGIHLGFLDEILSKDNCPFCRLAMQYVCRQRRTLNPETTIGGKRVECWLDNIRSWQSFDRGCGYDYDFVDAQVGEDHTCTGREIYRFTITASAYADGEREITNATAIHILADRCRPLYKRYCGRLVRRSFADLGLVRTWLPTCEKLHGSACAEPDWLITERLGFFRVIDVKLRRVICAPADCRYMALSYVWGGPQKVVASKGNFSINTNGETYMDLPPVLPRTIEDAISVVIALDHRYLWVDSLCIIQDDPAEKHDQIAHMDLIYGSADLTIVDAAGARADTGLAGLSLGLLNDRQNFETVKGLQLALTLPSFVGVVDYGSPWNTRGWTYQERLLSKRALIFSREQAYFLCSSAVWCEDVISEPDVLTECVACKNLATGRAPQRTFSLNTSVYNMHSTPRADDSILQAYINVVGSYSARKLSFAADALNAVSGVLGQLERAGLGQLRNGIPESYFDIALLWHYQGEWSEAEQSIFPSWSWAASMAGAGIAWDITSYLSGVNILPAVSWHIVGGTGNTAAISSIGLAPHDRSELDPSPGPLCISPRSISTAPPFPSSICSTNPDGGYYLYFWTSSARFTLGKELTWRTPFWEQPMAFPFQILDLAGCWAGSLLMSRAVRDRFADHPQEFIFLSYGSEFDYHVAEKLEYAKPTIKRGQTGSQNRWCVANVMLIEWKGPVAERVAIGRIHVEAWKASEVQGRWIILG